MHCKRNLKKTAAEDNIIAPLRQSQRIKKRRVAGLFDFSPSKLTQSKQTNFDDLPMAKRKCDIIKPRDEGFTQVTESEMLQCTDVMSYSPASECIKIEQTCPTNPTVPERQFKTPGRPKKVPLSKDLQSTCQTPLNVSLKQSIKPGRQNIIPSPINLQSTCTANRRMLRSQLQTPGQQSIIPKDISIEGTFQIPERILRSQVRIPTPTCFTSQSKNVEPTCLLPPRTRKTPGQPSMVPIITESTYETQQTPFRTPGRQCNTPNSINFKATCLIPPKTGRTAGRPPKVPRCLSTESTYETEECPFRTTRQTSNTPSSKNMKNTYQTPQRPLRNKLKTPLLPRHLPKIIGKSDSKVSFFPQKARNSQGHVFGWQTALNKYSPSKETQTSPVKYCQANLKSVSIKDMYLDMYIWTVNMSEQHYYDNAFLLISYCRNDPIKMTSLLHRDVIGFDMDFFNNLEQVTRLGQGAFGSVYSCYDQTSKLKFAVKHIFGEYKVYSDHAKNLLNYMSERNANIRAMNSCFVARIYGSLQLQNSGDSFLFLEFCIGDLDRYIKKIKFKEMMKISNWLYDNQAELTQNLYARNPELLEVCYVYIFEIFCALDFLVSCHIIHQDIKPDNIMISDNLHLKIGDFGLAYRTRTINKLTNNILIQNSEIQNQDRKNYRIQIEGTIDFQDFESHLLLMEIDDDDYLQRFLRSKKTYDTPGISFENEILETSFLVDTWAAGVIAVDLLFRGLLLFHPRMVDQTFYIDIPKESKSKFLMNLVGRKKVYDRYIHGGIVNGGGKENVELSEFIVSIFRPRLRRCESFTKEKSIYHYSRLVKMRYVDIDKIAQFKTFSDRHFNKSNIHLREIPDTVRKAFSKTVKPEEKKFSELLKEIESNRMKLGDPRKILNLNPGVSINFF